MQFDDFTRLYKVSKTLRFELKPVGKTLDHINAKGFIDAEKKSSDIQRAEDYKKMKEIIDRYHKDYIDRTLSQCSLPVRNEGKSNSLEEYADLYARKGEDEKAKNKFAKVQENLRKQIVQVLREGKAYKNIFKKELIREDLPAWNGLKKGELETVKSFKDFNTYFIGFFENRKNMYSDKEQSTAIAYRIVHENLPKFIDNIGVYEKISAPEEMKENIKKLSEELGITDIGEIFSLSYFNQVLTQRQIEIYNSVVGGKTNEKKMQGLNEYINLYNQQHSKEERLPGLRPLFKQILSDRESLSWLPAAFENDKQVLQAVRGFYEDVTMSREEDRPSVLESLRRLLTSLSDYDVNGIFVRNDAQISDVSQRMLGSWSAVRAAVAAQVKGNNALKKKKGESEEAFNDRVFTIVRKADSFSIRYLNDCLAQAAAEEEKEGKKPEDASERLVHVEEYFATLGGGKKDGTPVPDHFARISEAYGNAEALLASGSTISKNEKEEEGEENDVDRIKNLLDAFKDLLHFAKPLLGNGDESGKDERFYGEFFPLWQELDRLTPLYNMVRNYVTKKPYSLDKIKLNFQNADLLKGWDKNKEPNNACLILRKDGDYFLAVMDKEERKLLNKEMPVGGECYERMHYKYLPSPNKMLPKVFFSAKGKAEFHPSEQLLEKYDKKTHIKGEKFCLADCHALIDFFKTSIAAHEDWCQFGFRFSDTGSYEDISRFYGEVARQGYKVTFNRVSVAHIEKLVNEGKLYLFQIYNKDFSEHSKGTPNMHTLYWKSVFSEQNLADVVYKLNGEAEMFFRKHSIKARPTHPANAPVKNKNEQNAKKESVFSYDLIKDRRFTTDKFFLHVPITMNFKSNDAINLNGMVQDYLHSADDTHIIGIDRGERHLLYIVVIDRRGRIVEQCSLNEIVNEYAGNTYRTNYHELLDRREGDRDEARRSWKTIENIKELKEGYLSQVIHRIVGMMVKYHAIVVLEDLNTGFMRGRQKVEKQVYQKFEKMLIDKLNYLVDKHAAPTAAGGLLNAYQLTNKFESFRAMGKQSGFLFYIPAWNTSKIDPVTGFVNLLDARYANAGAAKDFFAKFDAIRYNAAKGYFEFELDYKNFPKKAEGTQTRWTLCTRGERISSQRDKDTSVWKSETVDLTAGLKAHFAEHGIDIYGDIKEQILKKDTEKDGKKFFKPLMDKLKLTLQMRNSLPGTEVDYLVSPVADAAGNFYDSRNAGPALPANADANGAYNIARKGLMIVRQVRAAAQPENLKFDLCNKSWLQFAQQKPYEDD